MQGLIPDLFYENQKELMLVSHVLCIKTLY